jgi:RHS repeat-associated protein
VGNVVDVKDPLGNKTLNAYDRRNRLIATKTNPVVVTSGSAGVSNNSNDIIVKYTYDVVGNRLKLIDAKGCVTQFTYDRINRLKTTVHDAEAVPGSGQPDVRTVEIDVYDAVVKISRKEGLYPNATGGLEFSYSYDNRLRLTTTTVVAGGTAADNSTRSYDELNRMWKVEQAADSGGTPRRVEYTFDRLDRILTENSAGLTNTSQYDVAGNRLTITYQSTQRTLTTAFDSHNRPTQIVDTQTGSSTTRTTTYGYNRNGSTVTKGLPNGVTETRGYDVLNRVNSIEAKGPGSSPVVFQSTTQSYDAASNLARIVETYPSTGVASRTVTNAYDRTYRLQSETAVVGSTTTITSWSYDKANNRLTESKQINGGTVLTTTYTIGDGTNGIASNQIKQFVRPGTGGTVGFTYNAFGNRATRADSATTVLTTYSYDPFSRLTQVLQSDSGTGQTRTHRYAYDYRTRRVVRHEPATLINGTPFPEGGLARRIVFSGGLSVLEYSGTGTTGTSLALQIIRGSDMGGGVGGILYALPYSVSGPQPTYFNFNSRGDVTTQTANTPGTTPTYQAAYEAFGSHPQQMGTAVTRHKANTKEEDPTGLLNEGFRYRDLETGAFITRDPAGFVDGPNLYTYVNQNPWTKFDPEGLFWSAIVTAGFAVYDTYQYASGNISGADYSGRMALNGAALLADAATGGMGGGVAIRTAALAARAGKVGQVAIKAAVAIDRADTAVSTAQAAISTTEAVEDGNYGRAAISAVQVAVTGKGMTKSAREVAEDTRKGVIALSEGRLSVGSSNAFDKGQREMADKLNLERVPTKRGHHAEENLMAAKDDLTAVGTYKRAPCGPSEHNCAGQLAERGIKESPFLGQVAKKVNNAGLSEPSRNRRTIAVGESAPKKFRTEDD